MSAPLPMPDYMRPMYDAWLERGGDETPPACKGCDAPLSAWAVERGYDYCSKSCREAQANDWYCRPCYKRIEPSLEARQARYAKLDRDARREARTSF